MSQVAEITYSRVPREFIVYDASGDEKGKTFHLSHYPIQSLIISGAEIWLKRDTDATKLVEDTDYLVDLEESSIILLVEVEEGDIIWINGYEYEDLYYRYMYNIRMILGDIDHKSFLYKNKEIIECLKFVLYEQILNETSWEIEYSNTYNRITTDIINYKFMYLAGFTALRLLSGKLRRKLNTAIAIKDGPTSIDTTKVITTYKEEIDTYRKTLVQELNDELIFGKDSTLLIGLVDNIMVFIGDINGAV